jgi:hypothetical protein
VNVVLDEERAVKLRRLAERTTRTAARSRSMLLPDPRCSARC